MSQAGADVRTAVSLTAAPTGGSAVVSVTGRRVGPNLEYRARLRFLPTGAVGVALSRLTGSTAEELIGSEVVVPGLTYTAGSSLGVRVQVAGTGTTQLAATVWPAGSPEPDTATVTRTDATASLQAPGGLAISAYLAASATAPLAVRFSGYRATAIG